MMRQIVGRAQGQMSHGWAVENFFGFLTEANFLACLFFFFFYASACKIAVASCLKFSNACGSSVYSGYLI
jgi:hypothetical protein